MFVNVLLLIGDELYMRFVMFVNLQRCYQNRNNLLGMKFVKIRVTFM